MKGNIVLLLVCLTSLQLIDAGRRSRSSYSRRSSSSGGSSSRSGSVSRSSPSNHFYVPAPRYSVYVSSSHKRGKGYSYASKGYGTRWGTNFTNAGTNTEYSNKTLGLGVAPGFLGVTDAGAVATYGVFHRYNKYEKLTKRYSWSYHQDFVFMECRFSCPYPAVCKYGICDCDVGYTKRYGRCRKDWSTSLYSPRKNFDIHGAPCMSDEQCFDYDFNLECQSIPSFPYGPGPGKCLCRYGMKWNAEAFECQLFLNVDCSNYTYETPISPAVEEAVKRVETWLENEEKVDNGRLNIVIVVDETDLAVLNDTMKKKIEDNMDLDNVLDTSLLSDIGIDPQTASKDEITEAYCRDVDALSYEFQKGVLTI